MTPLNEQLMNKLEDLANLIPSEEVEGESISLTDCAGVRPIDVKIKGNLYQDGDPDPDNPIDIDVLTGDVVFTITDAINISDLEVGTISSSTGANNTSTSGLRTDYIDYTGLSTLKWSGIDCVMVFCYDSDKTYLGSINSSWITDNPYTFTVLSNTAYIRVAFKDSNDIDVTTDDISNIILYNNLNEFNLSLGDLELCGDSTYGYDYLFKKNGKWYKHSLFKKITLDSNSKFTDAMTNYWYDGFSIFNLYNYTECDFILASQIATTYPHLLTCNYYTKETGFVVRGSSSSAKNGIIGICMWDTKLGIIIGTTQSSLDEFKAWLQECYDSGNPVVIYYELSTPVDTEITDSNLISQLEKISNAKLTKNNTVISSDNERCIIDLTYYKDIETLIN